MKVLSWNVRGLGDKGKRVAVKEVIHNSEADIVLIQESKLNFISDSIVKDVMWVCFFSLGVP